MASDRDRGPQLYVRPDDRSEVNNVIHHHPVLVKHLEAVQRGFVPVTRQPGPLQPPVLRDLEADLPETGAGDEGEPMSRER